MSQDFFARLHPRPRSPMPIKASVEGSGVVVVTTDSFTCPVKAILPPPLLGAGIRVMPLIVNVFGPNVDEEALVVPGPSWIGDQLILRLDEPAETLPPVEVPTKVPTPPSVVSRRRKTRPTRPSTSFWKSKFAKRTKAARWPASPPRPRQSPK